MTKKILIAIILGILILLVSLLVIFSKPKWINIFESESTEYLYSNLFEISENRFVGSLWIFEISATESDIHISHFNNSEEFSQIVLSNQIVGYREEIRMRDIFDGKFAPIFFSVEVGQEDKNIFQSLLCSYIGNQYCEREINFTKVEIYNNTYPYPTLTLNESKRLLQNSMQYIETKLPPIETDDARCSKLISEYLFKESNGKDVVGIVDSFNSIECKDLPTLLSYANLLDSSDALYTSIREKACKDIESYGKDVIEKVFIDTEIEVLVEMCNIENIYEPKDYKYEEENLNKLAKNILYLLNNRDDMEYDKRIRNLKEFLAGDVYTSWESPYCLNMYICNEELINLSKVIFEF